MSLPARAQEVLNFWFVESGPAQWFRKDEAFDETIRERFGGLVEEALGGALEAWGDSDVGAVALILVLDQFTRNLFRGEGRSYAGDEKALALSLRVQARGTWTAMEGRHKHFLLIPMMHSESLEIQERSLPLFKEHCGERVHDFGVRHRDIIARFGRFPHRNAALGRTSTPEEVAFLKEPGSSF